MSGERRCSSCEPVSTPPAEKLIFSSLKLGPGSSLDVQSDCRKGQGLPEGAGFPGRGRVYQKGPALPEGAGSPRRAAPRDLSCVDEASQGALSPFTVSTALSQSGVFPGFFSPRGGHWLRAALPIRFSKAGSGLPLGRTACWMAGSGVGVENTQEDVLGRRSFEARGEREICKEKEEKQV